VAEALADHTWVSDIRAALSQNCLMEYLELWDTLSEFHLKNSDGIHLWKFKRSGIFFLQDQPTELSLLEPCSLSLGKDCGRLGLLAYARSFCGLLSAIVVGQLIDYKEGDFRTQFTAPFATKRMKPPNICSPLVSSPGNYGSTSCSL